MIYDFNLLSDKVAQLAELAHRLRLENAQLRQQLADAGTENAELSRRMDEAHARVTALLEKMPAPETDKELV